MGAAFLKGKLSPPAQLIWQAFLVPLNCAVSDAAQLAVKSSRRGSASDAAATAFPVQAIRRGSVGDAAGNPFA